MVRSAKKGRAAPPVRPSPITPQNSDPRIQRAGTEGGNRIGKRFHDHILHRRNDSRRIAGHESPAAPRGQARPQKRADQGLPKDTPLGRPTFRQGRVAPRFARPKGRTAPRVHGSKVRLTERPDSPEDPRSKVRPAERPDSPEDRHPESRAFPGSARPKGRVAPKSCNTPPLMVRRRISHEGRMPQTPQGKCLPPALSWPRGSPGRKAWQPQGTTTPPIVSRVKSRRTSPEPPKGKILNPHFPTSQ